MALAAGGIKLALNLYRSRAGEKGTLWLRARVLHRAETRPPESMLEGVELSIVLAESEPVGGFVGTSISEPLLPIGVLVTVSSYLIYLQLMKLAVAATFAPRIAFVPDDGGRSTAGSRRRSPQRGSDRGRGGGLRCR
ncbi:hypothetical protein N2599_26020 (plasmid) [Rhizobium sullae]|uniref:Uncharacterized protein n=1 Tax=Rhizobium sullae TaxID=50338 RepID=A0ABY5XW08_RHISU|nr:hypothetical protein [Rhizobium sullae]UWU18658.1 hypothetical protein N2599_26020 [Rhizobium sullae]